MRIDLNNYSIFLNKGILDDIENYIDTNKTIVIFTDDGVPIKYIEKIKLKFNKSYLKIIAQGENSKNIDTYQSCINFLLENYITRNDIIISIGGGMVLDLCGFVASTYKRGVDFINIPTTTLSQIDSSIGGKVGINFNGIKNCVGSFYNPKMVLIDFNVLKTLEDRIYYEGVVEAIKAGLIKDKNLFELIENFDIKENIESIVYRSLLIKKQIVEEDPYEKNIRKLLNFGHTIGHAYESYFNYKYNHGECVGMGMLSIIDDFNIKYRLKNLLNKINMPIKNNANKDEVFKYIKNDKKINNDLIDIVVLKEIGVANIISVNTEYLRDRCCLNEK